jgi:hypothetical protein
MLDNILIVSVTVIFLGVIFYIIHSIEDKPIKKHP